MKKNHLCFVSGLTALVALVLPATAADRGQAAADLAEIASISVQAKANLSAAALGGNVDSIAEAMKRSDAVDAAGAEALSAHGAMERSLAGGEADAAESAIDDLKAALKKARDALQGVIPEPSPQSKHQAWKEALKNTGGGPGRARDPLSHYDVPWKSEGIRSYYTRLFGNFWNASGFGAGRGFGDRDATPE